MESTEIKGSIPTGRRVLLDHQEEIGAPPEDIFPLLCPVAEYDWIENWDCRVAFTRSGVNEEGCIFTEQIMSPFLFGTDILVTWVTDTHDPDNFLIRFVIFAPDTAVVRYTVRLTGLDRSRTSMDARFELTVLPGRLPELADEEIRKRLKGMVALITASLKHYCETGKMLRG
jgi:hypothetical protein